MKQISFVFLEQNQCKILHLKPEVGARSKSYHRGLKIRSSFQFWLLTSFMRKAISFWNILKISSRPSVEPTASLCTISRHCYVTCLCSNSPLNTTQKTKTRIQVTIEHKTHQNQAHILQQFGYLDRTLWNGY